MAAPIALFVYSRPLHTRRTVDALRRNELATESDLIIFSDAARSMEQRVDVQAVRDYVRTISGFRSVSIVERAENAGLARSIIDGVTNVVAAQGRVIVLEDDLVTSPWFLRYMNQALRLYENNERVASIHGYCYPVAQPLPETFFMRGADCWGWATWGRAWQHFEENGSRLLSELTDRRLEKAFDLWGSYGFTNMLREQVSGANESWAIRWHAACFLKDLLTLYPGKSLVQNIGIDGSGTHGGKTDNFSVSLSNRPINVERIELTASKEGEMAFARFLSGTKGHVLRRAVASAKRLLRLP